jgi:hypothetical protein
MYCTKSPNKCFHAPLSLVDIKNLGYVHMEKLDSNLVGFGGTLCFCFWPLSR